LNTDDRGVVGRSSSTVADAGVAVAQTAIRIDETASAREGAVIVRGNRAS
jgi:hypothetical protein